MIDLTDHDEQPKTKKAKKSENKEVERALATIEKQERPVYFLPTICFADVLKELLENTYNIKTILDNIGEAKKFGEHSIIIKCMYIQYFVPIYKRRITQWVLKKL